MQQDKCLQGNTLFMYYLLNSGFGLHDYACLNEVRLLLRCGFTFGRRWLEENDVFARLVKRSAIIRDKEAGGGLAFSRKFSVFSDVFHSYGTNNEMVILKK